MYRWQLQLGQYDPRSIDGDHVAMPMALCASPSVDNLPNALTCARHNRSHGATLGNRLRRATRHRESPPAEPPIW
jgi:hypothetical protein